jgi:predicted DsbA family dithiol-disulfide isomerase
MQLELYVDLACPWSYMGKRNLEWALAASERGSEFAVLLRPFLAEPISPTRAAADSSVMVAASAGIDYRPDQVVQSDTLAAHRLVWLAGQELGSQAARRVMDRVFLAHFTEGRNIADVRTLTDIGRRSGLDERRLQQFLASDEGVAEQREELRQARDHGITAAPTIVFGNGRVLVGAHDSVIYLDTLEELATDADNHVRRDDQQVAAERACA